MALLPASGPKLPRGWMATSAPWLIYVVFTVSSVIFAVWWAQDQRATAVRHVIETQQETKYHVQVAAEAMESHLQNMRNQALLIAHSPLVVEDDLAALYRWGVRIVRDSQIPLTNLVVHSDDGRQLINTRLPFKSPALPQNRGPENQKMFVDMVRTGRATFSGVFNPPVITEPIVVVMVPVMRDGILFRTLSLTTTATQIRDVLARHAPQRTRTLVVADQTARIVARLPEHDAYVGMSVVPEFTAAASVKGQWRDEGVWQGVNIRHELVFGAYRKVDISGWVVVAAVPVAAFTASGGNHRWVFGFLAAVLAGTGIFGWQLSRRIYAGEVRQDLANRELDHRVKNILARVGSLVMNLSRSTAPTAETMTTLYEWIQVFSRQHDKLRQEGWEGEHIVSLMESELGIFRTNTTTVSLSGTDIFLPPNLAEAITMLIHELATNASKYGAFSVGGGGVEVEWCHVQQTFRMIWREFGGPTIRCLPTRRGFGTRLIYGLIEKDLGGKVTREFLPQGLQCTIEIPYTDKT